MKIELKNIKHMESLSEETNCYSATLHVNGKKIGEVSNQGHGGPDNFYGDRAAFDEAEAWLAANKPAVDLGDDMTIPMDMELFCGEILSAHLISKDLKKVLRSRILFVEDGKDGMFQLRWKGVRKVEDRHVEVVRNKHPRAKILNAMPFQEALEVYMANS
jgi:hypothetical protein